MTSKKNIIGYTSYFIELYNLLRPYYQKLEYLSTENYDTEIKCFAHYLFFYIKTNMLIYPAIRHCHVE